MSENLLSVIVPIYNAEKTIKRCVDSIVDQTYRNLEIILVDDESTDDTKIILEKYLNDKRVKIIHKKNEGVSIARNTGLKNAQGDYVTFVDSDDYLELDVYQKVMAEVVLNHCDVLSFSANVAFVDDGYNVLRTYDDVVCDQNKLKQVLSGYLSSGLFHIVWNKIYRKDIIEKENIYFLNEATNYEDVEFNYRIFEKISSFQHVNYVGYTYIRSKEESLLSKFVIDNDQIFKASNDALKAFIINMGLTNNEDMHAYYVQANFMNLENFVINLYKRNNNLSYLDKIRDIKKIVFDKENIRLIKEYEPNYLFGKIFKRLCLLHSSHFLCISYAVFTFGKQHFYSIFKIIRKN